MISLEQINAEIAALEEEKPSYQVMERLADMYVVRDHMVIGDQSKNQAAVSAQTAHIGSNSEFAKSIDGKSIDDVMSLFDELMEALAVTNPRLYDCVMRRL